MPLNIENLFDLEADEAGAPPPKEDDDPTNNDNPENGRALPEPDSDDESVASTSTATSDRSTASLAVFPSGFPTDEAEIPVHLRGNSYSSL